MSSAYPFPDKAGIEPTLAELFEDQTLMMLLNYDRLSMADVLKVIAEWRKAHSLDSLSLPNAA